VRPVGYLSLPRLQGSAICPFCYKALTKLEMPWRPLILGEKAGRVSAGGGFPFAATHNAGGIIASGR